MNYNIRQKKQGNNNSSDQTAETQTVQNLYLPKTLGTSKKSFNICRLNIHASILKQTS